MSVFRVLELDVFIEGFPVVVGLLPVGDGEAVERSDYALVEEETAFHVRVRPRVGAGVVVVERHLREGRKNLGRDIGRETEEA